MNVNRPLLFYAFLYPSLVTADDEFNASAEVELGYGYDSNVTVDDVDVSTNVGDHFLDLRLSGDLSYKTKKDAEFSAGITISDKFYNTFDQFDGLLTLASLAASKEIGDWEYSLAVRYVDYQLDGSGLLSLSQVSPTLAWFPSKKSYIRLAYTRTDESYDDNDVRNNDRDEIGASLYYFVNGLRQYVAFQAEIADEQAESDIFDNDSWQIRIAYYHRLNVISRDSTIKLAYRYQERDYDQAINPRIGEFRADKRHRYEIELTIPLNERWSVLSEIIYNDYQSNLESSDYNQHLYQLTIRYRF